METVSVKINVSNQRGRKILRELCEKKEVEIISPDEIGDVRSGSTWKVIYERGLDKLSAHYGVDMRKLKSKL